MDETEEDPELWVFLQELERFQTVVFRDYSLKLSSILAEAALHSKIVDMQVKKFNYFTVKLIQKLNHYQP